jgi:hypothetical protein
VELVGGKVVAYRAMLAIIIAPMRLQQPEQAAQHGQLDSRNPPHPIHFEFLLA